MSHDCILRDEESRQLLAIFRKFHTLKSAQNHQFMELFKESHLKTSQWWLWNRTHKKTCAMSKKKNESWRRILWGEDRRRRGTGKKLRDHSPFSEPQRRSLLNVRRDLVRDFLEFFLKGGFVTTFLDLKIYIGNFWLF